MRKNYLFKYVSLKDLERISDIIFKERLYAPKYLQLNDPMDTYLSFEPLSEDCAKEEKEKRLQVSSDRAKARICCLSKVNPFTREAVPMWAHYADGFAGACLAFEVFDSPDWERIDVEYTNDIPQLPCDAPLAECFKYKLMCWKDEQEVRFLSVGKDKDDIKWFNSITLAKVVLGYKADANMLEIIRSFVDRTHLRPHCERKIRNLTTSEPVYRLTKGQTQEIILKGDIKKLVYQFK